MLNNLAAPIMEDTEAMAAMGEVTEATEVMADPVATEVMADPVATEVLADPMVATEVMEETTLVNSE